MAKKPLQAEAEQGIPAWHVGGGQHAGGAVLLAFYESWLEGLG